LPNLRIVRRVDDLRRAVADMRGEGDRIGLVPTMGALHEGHLSLVRQARGAAERVVATIFVNPAQFAPGEDLSRYPRDEASDATLLELEGVELLFAPAPDEVYPAGFSTTVVVDGLTRHLCGPFRPGHFQGVATVVAKLLLMALPDRAYFGEKDFQQLQVIRRLACDLNVPVEIVGAPTVREDDGLALSSRNRYLDAAQRRRAALLPQAMREAAGKLADGREAAPILAGVKADLKAAGFDAIDYVELCASDTLEPIAEAADRPCRLFIAAWIGATRLIDNWPVRR
jgi:pantoate--beta-alanine ligase